MIIHLLWFLLWGLALLPRRSYASLSQLVFLVWRLFARKNKQILYGNISYIWGYLPTTDRAKHFARQVISSQTEVFFDTLRGILRPASLKLQGLEELGKLITHAETQGRGQILISAHVGSWELVGKCMSMVRTKGFFVLAKPPRHRVFLPLMHKLRKQMNCDLIWTGDREQVSQSMATTLQRGDSLGLVMDQKPRNRQGPEVQFFDQPTPFVAGPAVLARQHACPIIGIFCLRIGPGHYRLESRLLVQGEEAAGKSVVALTQICAREIERIIRQYPEQWCWNYKRWVLPSSPAETEKKRDPVADQNTMGMDYDTMSRETQG